MKPSENALRIIMSHESLRLKAYRLKRPDGSWERDWTIGWGHYGPDVYPDMVINKLKADLLLGDDVAEKASELNRLLEQNGITVNQNQFDAMLVLVFNVGTRALRISRCFKHIKSGDYESAMKEWDWGTVTEAQRRTNPGLIKRRAEERALFMKPC